MAYSGRYTPTYPAKYHGNPTEVFYRSLWERWVMKYLDHNEAVVWWSSEEVAVPYRSPLDNKPHRYFPDFLLATKQPDGTLKTFMLEVKPEAQTKPPIPLVSGRQTRRYLIEVLRWGVNEAKWNAARAYCADRKWEFVITTERNLPFS